MSSHTLPSFAQAFSALDDRDRALPPIHTHPHSLSHSRASPFLRHEPPRQSRHDSRGPPPSLPPLKHDSRKRARERDDETPEPSSPSVVKQEQDVDQLDPSPSPPPPPPLAKAPSPARPARTRQQLHLNTNVGNLNNASSNTTATANNAGTAAATNSTTTAMTSIHAHAAAAPPPPPHALVARQQQHPPSKRRRVTISGVAHPNMHASISYANEPVHVHHTPPPTHTGPSTPISPVVMGFSIQHDPQAVEQMRAMLAIKQKQKALIESRRGSTAGLGGVEASSGRRGSVAGLGGVDGAGRRASVAAPSVTVNVVNPTPTTATGPGPAQGVSAPPLRRTGSSPNGHRLGPTPPSLSPNVRANASRTRSPSLLGGAREKSPAQSGGTSQTTRPAANPGSSSNLSPPSHHRQAHPNVGSARPNMPSPPQPPAAANNTNTPSTNQGQASNPPPPPSFVNQSLSAFANNLPPPPNSFTRRRAGQLGLRGNKPADLMLSPRDPESGPVPSSNNKASGSAVQSNSAAPSSQPQAQSQGGQQPQQQQQQPPHAHRDRGMHMPSLPAVPVHSTYKSLQPAIQSAPPRPGQQPGRFPMTLPSLPPAFGTALGGGGGSIPRAASVRKVGGQVPPTPTKLSMQRAQGTAEAASVRLSQPTGLPRVPRTATAATFAVPHGPSAVAASGALMTGGMPRTPATLHRATAAGSSSEKAAFLAPFEQFYDALSDAQVLKGWFGEQLRRVGALAKEGEAQIARMKAASSAPEAGTGVSRGEVESLVREAVKEEVKAWRDEVTRLRAQVAELQDTLAYTRGSGSSGMGTSAAGKENEMGKNVNGRSLTPPMSSASAIVYSTAPDVESYTFPPVPRPPPAASQAEAPLEEIDARMEGEDGSKRLSVPEAPAPAKPFSTREASTSESAPSTNGRSHSISRSTTSSPAPSDSGSGGLRRMSVSAMRFEPQNPNPAPSSNAKGPIALRMFEERERRTRASTDAKKGDQSGSAARKEAGGEAKSTTRSTKSDERVEGQESSGREAKVAESAMDES